MTNPTETNPTDGIAAAAKAQAEKAARERETTAIQDFWTWWKSGGAQALDAMFSAQLGVAPGAGGASGSGADGATGTSPLDSDNPADLGIGEVPLIDIRKEVGERISAINPTLIWGFEAGAPFSKHLLTVSAAGNPESRPAARRWLDAAPDDDDIWSFTDLRQADESIILNLGDIIAQFGPAAAEQFPAELAQATVNPADAQVAVTSGHGAVDVTLFHPIFADLIKLDDQEMAQRIVMQLGFTLLQLTLGEEDFGLWMRGFAFSAEEPEGAIALPQLKNLVEELATNCPEWLTIDAEAEGRPVRVVTRAPITQLIAPTCTRHVVAQLLFSGATEGGLPTEETLAALNAFSDDTVAQLGDDGIQVATESSDGVALLHFYVDPVSDAEEKIRKLVDTWQLGETDLDAADDAGWQRVGHLRV